MDSTDDSIIPFVEEFHLIDPRFRIVINDLIWGPVGTIKKGTRTAVGKAVVIINGDGIDDLQQVV